MAISTFDQFESYVAAVEDADLRMMLPRLERPQWEINAFSVGDLHVQCGREGSGNITEGSSLPGGQILFVPLAGLHRANGIPMQGRSVFLMRPGSEFTISVHEAHDWCSVFIPWSLPNEHSPPGSLPSGHDKNCRVLGLTHKQKSSLGWLLSRLARAVKTEPKLLSEPSSLRSMHHDLNMACRNVIAGPSGCNDVIGRPRLPRRDLISVVRELLDQHFDEGLKVKDLAAAADVSERTLRAVFVEYYGVPPQQYLLTHRLHRVRSDLRETKPGQTTVTASAAKFGFWHFGRFAAAYRKLFGESPSTTLHGATGQRTP